MAAPPAVTRQYLCSVPTGVAGAAAMPTVQAVWAPRKTSTDSMIPSFSRMTSGESRCTDSAPKIPAGPGVRGNPGRMVW